MRKFEGCFEVVWNVALRDVLRFSECGLEVDLCEVLRLFEGYFKVVALRVVLRLFEGCFEVVSSVALRVVLKVVLRLYGMLLWGCFECCFEVV